MNSSWDYRALLYITCIHDRELRSHRSIQHHVPCAAFAMCHVRASIYTCGKYAWQVDSRPSSQGDSLLVMRFTVVELFPGGLYKCAPVSCCVSWCVQKVNFQYPGEFIWTVHPQTTLYLYNVRGLSGKRDGSTTLQSQLHFRKYVEMMACPSLGNLFNFSTIILATLFDIIKTRAVDQQTWFVSILWTK